MDGNVWSVYESETISKLPDRVDSYLLGLQGKRQIGRVASGVS